ncbi:pro-resilin [Hyalella azteca]|uniref:Pro-resilin n=1 Tax=Hyalella azteca TaxID=294128 RepID=A0A8B7NYF9_HYAAZ|nr:pro-resilin [Hyalella azteca]
MTLLFKPMSLCVVFVLLSATAAQQYASPPARPTSYGGGGDGGGSNDSPASYSYSYTNKDAASGNQFGHGEERNRDSTQGQYRVLLPDGRTQIVRYNVNGNAGYIADVTYEGTAHAAPPSGGGNQLSYGQ